jgi:hypothetical protein
LGTAKQTAYRNSLCGLIDDGRNRGLRHTHRSKAA